MRVLNIPTEVRIGAVVSIPAFFHNGQRRAIQSAAKLANIEVKELVVEPTAGAMAHKYYSSVAEDDLKLFQVFDYGGGTLDCSVMRCTGLECEVLGVAGNSTLGGIDYDRVIREIIIDKLKIDKTKINEGELLEDSEMIKKWLSKNDQYSYKYKDKSSIIITRTEFEKHPKTQKLVESAMKLAKLAMNGSPKVFKFSNIRMILMIGGSSNLPIIRKTIEKTFSTSNRHSITVQYLEEGDSQLMVTAGSAVLAGYMAYDRKITVSNVIPLPLGFSVCHSGGKDCGHMDIVVEKNTQYPLEVNKTYCQHKRSATSSTLKLYEGENPKVVDNHFISKLRVKNLIPYDGTCKNIGTHHVIFRIDENGIVTIHGVAHKEDGSDGDVYTMSLSLSTDDGSLLQTQINKMKRKLESWFNIKKVKDEL
eukprot:548576_1